MDLLLHRSHDITDHSNDITQSSFRTVTKFRNLSIYRTPHARHMAHLLEEPGGEGVAELPVLQQQESPEGGEVSADAALREEVLH